MTNKRSVAITLALAALIGLGGLAVGNQSVSTAAEADPSEADHGKNQSMTMPRKAQVRKKRMPRGAIP